MQIGTQLVACVVHPPVNKGRSSIPMALRIFFHLPEARVDLPGLEWLQHSEEIIQKNEERLRNLWDNFKHSNIRIIGVPEGEEED